MSDVIEEEEVVRPHRRVKKEAPPVLVYNDETSVFIKLKQIQESVSAGRKNYKLNEMILVLMLCESISATINNIYRPGLSIGDGEHDDLCPLGEVYKEEGLGTWEFCCCKYLAAVRNYEKN